MAMNLEHLGVQPDRNRRLIGPIGAGKWVSNV